MNHDAIPVFKNHRDGWSIGCGLTPISAAKLLAHDFPDVPQWMVWSMELDLSERAIRGFVGDGMNNNGKIGNWIWERVPCSYGNVALWSSCLNRKRGCGWIGVLRISGPNGESFLIFSYLRIDMALNAEYLVSTGDLKLLRRFADDVDRHLRPSRRRNVAIVNVIGNQADFKLNTKEVEPIFLPDSLHDDILAQVDGFFGSKKVYKEMNIPFKRGFLFAGLPGTGKTLLIRKLIRHVHIKYRIPTSYLAITRRTEANDLRRLLNSASAQEPALLILEDMESLCHETQLTRSEVLAELDGIGQRSGMLLIATANDPSRIDPALLHRPSRFDRVWTFPLPDFALRKNYVVDQFANLPPETVDFVASETEDWTMAYMKELRNTAGILAIRDGLNRMEARHVKEALNLLQEQFKAGKTGHADMNKSRRKTGFGFNTPDNVGKRAHSVA